MPGGYVETVCVEGRWTNWIGGHGPSHHVYDSKDRAVAEGRRLARSAGVRHIIESIEAVESTRGEDAKSRSAQP
jgi:hypothetical protein